MTEFETIREQRDRAVRSLKFVYLDVVFMVEHGHIPNVLSDASYQEAKTVLDTIEAQIAGESKPTRTTEEV